jgi:hypothetical protein
MRLQYQACRWMKTIPYYPAAKQVNYQERRCDIFAG